MNRTDERIAALASESARQRERLARSLSTWRVGAHRIDDTTRKVHDHRTLVGLAAGFGAGLLVALRPSLLIASARAAVTVLPLLRMLRR